MVGLRPVTPPRVPGRARAARAAARRRAARPRRSTPGGSRSSRSAISRIWTGTIRAVIRPRMPSSIAGSAKPGLSRSNQAGAETAAKISSTIASAAASGSTPRLQRSDEERDHQVDDDVGDLEQLRALQHVPAADGDDSDQERGDEQEHDDDQARQLRGRLGAVRVLDPHPGVCHRAATLQSRCRTCGGSGRGGTGRRARFRSSWPQAVGVRVPPPASAASAPSRAEAAVLFRCRRCRWPAHGRRTPRRRRSRRCRPGPHR